ncbi:type II toxin-antitoxin system VapC family toxin [Actinomadura litoris]|uniref:type II toxin-antitoxin system VapC family toxin n=1 Tax=Actinomadura litoris TaxID=2678616 RepID=UPI001FA735C2|nr:PIN domain-containing protein [Actinomadura litoris]
MPRRTPLIYPDSCVYLDAITRNEDKHPETGEPRWKIANELFAEWLDDNVRLATSPLVEAEVFCKSTDRRKRSERVVEKLRTWFDSVQMQRVDIDRFVAREAIQLHDRYGHLHLPGKKPIAGADALHLAAAKAMGCDYFMTQDGGFPLGEQIGKMQVILPRPVWDPRLPGI